MGLFFFKQKTAYEIDRRIATGRRVQADGDRGRGRREEERVHAQRLRDVGIIRHVHLAERHRLQRLLRRLPQHRRRPVANLLPRRGRLVGTRGIALRAHHVVERRRQIGVRETLRDDTINHSSPPPPPPPSPPPPLSLHPTPHSPAHAPT